MSNRHTIIERARKAKEYIDAVAKERSAAMKLESALRYLHALRGDAHANQRKSRA